METHTKSLKTKKNKQQKIDNIDLHIDDTSSIHSTDPNEPLINNIAHNLFILAVQQARNERYQAKIRQQHTQKIRIKSIKQKKQLTIADIDRVFEEKRLRPSSIKNDLINLYKNSSNRIRSMLDIHQIDQFIQAQQHRALINKL
ncbi:unnamed protein product [Adineta steineri]|uniref:Uncharacterized protein n=1 Tax=Adineta steineri TaxID=433720 RepID=A0A815JRC2_9BILA|nr:unnamed protein product [Adineta steineri]CAF1383265.1 unnamed protein product [Adineta steineri]CAF1593749.1 unnamed protein product [Adineta steineri]CAF1608372.1 unnamed protein product [Adineta steineri]